MIINTNALVIKEQTVGESDKLVTLLTEKNGVIRAFAKRAKNFKDSKSSATSLLSYSKMSIYCGSDKYIIDSAKSIEIFFDLRNDIEALSLAQYFCEISANIVPAECESDLQLRIILNSLHFLCKKNKHFLQIKAITELKLMSVSGYMPDLVACQGCACYENNMWTFLVEGAIIYCNDCFEKEKDLQTLRNNYKINALQINQSVLTAMRFIIYSPIEKIYSFSLPKKDVLSLCNAVEKYTINILGKTPMTLDFFKTINEEPYEQ